MIKNKEKSNARLELTYKEFFFLNNLPTKPIWEGTDILNDEFYPDV